MVKANFRFWVKVFLSAAILAGCSFRLNPSSLPTRVIELPFEQTNLSFDELSYDAGLDRVIIPAAETGTLALINPTTEEIQLIQGFSKQITSTDRIVGTTSAISVQKIIYALDRAARKIYIIDPGTRKIINAADLEAEPEYLRFVSATNEIWVTEPALEQIEVFRLKSGSPPSLEKTQVIPVANGPEALLIDQSRGLAYTNQPEVGTTVVIQVMTHNIIDTWGNGCSKARGLALDPDRGLLFVVCNEGKLVLMDTNQDGLQITSQNYGGDLNFVVYNPTLSHVYLPSAASAVVAIFAVVDAPSPTSATPANPGAAGGEETRLTPVPTPGVSLVRLGTADTALNASCITVDNQNNLWICDPENAQMIIIHDSFPPSGS